MEVNFGLTNDVEKLKKKLKLLISLIDARMKSRFMRGTYLPTMNIIASSKNSDQSFLDDYINNKKKNESTTTLIVDEPQWVVDNRKDSPIHFYVAVGNKFLANELLPKDAPEALVDEYRAKGYLMLEVPIGYYENFLDNIDGALTDIAGIATASSLKYISGIRWNEIKTDTYENPFKQEIIEVGNAKDDVALYSDFFDLTKVPVELKGRPMFIHLDQSIKGDKTGIAGVYITGKKPKIEGEDASRELFFKVAFSVSIKAPKGSEISFDKNRAFIRWLRDRGFAIKSISCDTFLSAQILQQLIADGFDVQTISVDRLDSETKSCLPYAYLKSTIYDRRIEVYRKCDFLTEEVLGLERLSDGHIQHPDAGTHGCFTGNTKVSLVDGRELSFLELVDEFNEGKSNYVYSFNESTKRVEPKLIEKAWCTKKGANLVRVILDNGQELKCTPDHRFMLRDGSYVEAQSLIPGDSLMPLYRMYQTKEETPMYEYRLYYEPIEDKWHYEHRRFVTEELDGSHLIVHHKNCNKNDNTPTNLVYCSKQTHVQIHKDLCTGAWSPEAKKKRSASLKQWHANAKGTPAYEDRSRKLAEAVLSKLPEGYHEKLLADLEAAKLHAIQIKLQAELNKQKVIDYHKAMENTFGVIWDNLSNNEKDSYAVKYQRLTHPETQEVISRAISLNHSEGKYINSDIALKKCNEESKRLKKLIPEIDKDKFKSIFGFDYDSLPVTKKPPYAVKYRRIVGKEILNHKVISVEFLDETADVYDITVLDNHNFALAAGIFVHNSKDSIDAVCGSLWNASKHADEFAFEYGEDLQAAVDVGLTLDADEQIRRQVSVDFEEELKKMYNYNEQNVFKDFGWGPAKELVSNSYYLSLGIIV